MRVSGIGAAFSLVNDGFQDRLGAAPVNFLRRIVHIA
jgi:hypothetical protein